MNALAVGVLAAFSACFFPGRTFIGFDLALLFPSLTPLDSYFLSRHPYDKGANIRPFDSLKGSIWASLGSAYFILASFCILAYHLLKHHLPHFERDHVAAWIFIDTIFNPTSMYWQRIVKAGLLFQLIGAFISWQIHVFYGINLRDSLINQHFEAEINGWGNLSLFDTQIGLQKLASTLNLAPNWLYQEFNVFNSELQDAKVKVKKLFYIKLATDEDLMTYSDWMSASPSPRDFVFIATE